MWTTGKPKEPGYYRVKGAGTFDFDVKFYDGDEFEDEDSWSFYWPEPITFPPFPGDQDVCECCNCGKEQGGTSTGGKRISDDVDRRPVYHAFVLADDGEASYEGVFDNKTQVEDWLKENNVIVSNGVFYYTQNSIQWEVRIIEGRVMRPQTTVSIA